MKNRFIPWLAGALLCAFGVVRIAQILPQRSHENDFAHYYVTSRLWLEGKDPYNTPFAPEFAKYGFRYDPQIPSAGNAPPLVALFAPFSMLPPGAAFRLWVVIEAAALVATLLLIGTLAGDRVPRRMLMLLTGLLVASNTLYFHFYYSQVQLVLGVLLLAAYKRQRSGHHATALLLASAAALLKVFPITILPWFVLTARGTFKRRVLDAVPAIGLSAAAVLCTWNLWPGFLSEGTRVVRDYVPLHGFNYSLPSLVVNLGWVWCGLAPSVAQRTEIWRVAYAAGALLVASAYVAYRRYDLETGFCLQLVVMTFASPIAWGHYLVLLFFPFAVFASELLPQLTTRRLVAIAVVYAFSLELGNAGAVPGPLSVRVFASYLPLYSSLWLAFWFGAIRTCPPQNCGTRSDESDRAFRLKKSLQI